MGQLVGVVEKQSTTPGVVRFELNRSLSGMGHETFASASDADGSKPSAALARELFGTGKVDRVYVYGNMVMVDISKGHDSEGLIDVVRELYRYWKPGVEPPSFEDLQPDEPAAAPPGVAGGDAEISEVAKKIPADLLERSRAARERWKAKQG